MREAREVQVPAGYKEPLLGDEIEDAKAVLRGESFVDVEFAGHLRPRDLDFRHMHGVAPHHQRFAR